MSGTRCRRPTSGTSKLNVRKNALIAHPVHPFALHIMKDDKISPKGLEYGEEEAKKTIPIKEFEKMILDIMKGKEN